jgi:hypothetical protein
MAMNEMAYLIASFKSDLKAEYQEAKKRQTESYRIYKETLNSKKHSNSQKLITNLIATIQTHELRNLTQNLFILNCLLADIIVSKSLEKSLNELEKQLVESKFLEKCKDIDDIKKLKSILKAQKDERERVIAEARKLVEESRKKDLTYVD